MHFLLLGLTILSALIPSQAYNPSHKSLQNTRRLTELTFERDINSGDCSFIALRETQLYRGLKRGDDLRVLKSKTQNGNERIAVVAFGESVLRKKARSICGGQDILGGSMTPIEGSNNPGETPQLVLSTPDSRRSSLVEPEPPELEIEPLIRTGPSNNRVDFVFFSDGYLAKEKGKFLEDARRLAEDVSYNQTFYTVKPLLNFWAAFTPSKESGIGVNGEPKDTTYGLYRDGTELRGVYYSKPEVARAACLSMGDKCNYPILVGNDPYYGGLGGEFTVITPSLANGPLVLRHELGHSVIDVGEEYDGGESYFGVNAAHDLSEPIPWAHWLSSRNRPRTSPNYDAAISFNRVERSVMPLQAYPWTLLDTTTPWKIKFTSPGTYSRYLVRFSLSGIPESSDLLVELDGKDLGWQPRKDIGVDRWHYDIYRNVRLDGGEEHELSFTLRNHRLEGLAQLCSCEILEFGSEEEFISTPGHYGLYPTFSDKNETTYRPTNEDCLMRVVTSPNLCFVCVEGLWLSLLHRVDFIDDIIPGCKPSPIWPREWVRTLDLKLVPLGQLRYSLTSGSNSTPEEFSKERYFITWSKNGRILEQFQDRTHIELDDEEGPGVYAVRVQFETDEVRVDPEGLLFTGAEYNVGEKCSG